LENKKVELPPPMPAPLVLSAEALINEEVEAEDVISEEVGAAAAVAALVGASSVAAVADTTGTASLLEVAAAAGPSFPSPLLLPLLEATTAG
jgi:hypothetical protein